MDITYLGRSCFKIKGKQATIITDPYSPEYGLLGKQSAAIVTVSHGHSDHSYAEGIDGVTKVLSRCGEYEISGVLVNGFPSYHDATEGAERGKNVIFTYTIDDVTIAHLGDLGHTIDNSLFEGIGNIDVLLVPVGSIYTINAKQAATITRTLEPKYVIPMHYQRDNHSQELDPVDNFFKEMGVNKPEAVTKLTFTKASLPDATTVVLMDVLK